MYRVLEITSKDELMKWEPVWDQWLAETAIDNPYLKFGWFRIAFEFFEGQRSLRLLLVEDDGRVMAIAPLLQSVEKRLGFRMIKLGFLNNVYTPLQDVIAKPNDQQVMEIILQHLSRNHHTWDLLEFKEIRLESERNRLLSELAGRHNLFCHSFFVSRSWCVPTHTSWEEGQDKISAKTLKEFRRKIKRAEKLGRLSLTAYTDYSEIEKHLDIFFTLYKLTWKGEEPNADFYYAIAQEFSKTQSVVLYALYLNETPIAYMYGLRIAHTLYGLKTTYDPAFYAYSPGIILFYKILAALFQDPQITAFDIGRGEERYKQEMASSPIYQYNLVLGHRKSLWSLFYHCRYTLSAYVKTHRATARVLSVAQRAAYTIKTLPGRWVKRRASLWQCETLTLFEKKVSTADAENPPTGLQCQKASIEEQDLLAVAMKAKNLKEIGDRLEAEACYVVRQDHKPYAYFWFDSNPPSDAVKLAAQQILLKEYGLTADPGEPSTLKGCLDAVLPALAQAGFVTLLAVAVKADKQKNDELLSWGLQKLTATTKITFFSISLKFTRKAAAQISSSLIPASER